jgi:hypothetical protein
MLPSEPLRNGWEMAICGENRLSIENSRRGFLEDEGDAMRVTLAFDIFHEYLNNGI